MRRISSYLTVGVVAAGLILVSAAETSARPPGGRPSGGRPSGGRSSGYRPQYQQQHSQYRHDYDHRGSSFGGVGLGVGIGLGLGAYQRNSYQRGYYSPDEGYIERYVEPGTVYPAESAPAYAEPSERRSQTYLRILLPDADGRVWVDGLESTTDGASRMWGFPDESANKPYVHKVKAAFNRGGKSVTEEREVRVMGNTTAVVDFTRPIAPEPETPSTPPEESP